MKINWNKTFYTIGKFVNAHKSTILGTMGIGTSVAAAVTMANAAYNHGYSDGWCQMGLHIYGDGASESKEHKKARTKQNLKGYILPVTLELGAVGMLTASLILSEKKQKDMAAAYASLAAYISAYKIKMKEINQAECEELIENDIPIGYTPEEKDILADTYAKEQIKYLTKDSLPTNSEVLWFYDELSERWYKSTMVDQLKAELEVNQQYQLDGYVSLAFYYDCVDASLNDSAFYNTLGWDCEVMVYENDAYFIEFIHCKKFNKETGEWGWSVEPFWAPTDSYYLANEEPYHKSLIRRED